MPRSSNMLDQVAEGLAAWVEDTADQLAEAMMTGGNAPFSVQLTQQQKLDYYTAKLFNPDGTPNLQGRVGEMQRLGPEGFQSVYREVIKEHPEFAVPAPPPGAVIPPGPLG